MPDLPGHREVYLRLFAVAGPERRAELARALAVALGAFGVVTVHDLGPYWKIPENLEFTVRLEPGGQVADCVRELIEGSGPGWRIDAAGPEDGGHDATWIREPGGVLLHPAVDWAHLVSEQAPRPPRFRPREIVRVRADGRLLWVRGSAAASDGTWGYALQMLEEDIDPDEFMPHIVEHADEDALEPTGRFVPEDDEPPSGARR